MIKARHLPGALLIMMFLCLPGRSEAQGDAKQAPKERRDTGSSTTTAKEHYDAGITHYNLGRFRQAVSEFEQAYELTHEPILLFNIAQAYRQADETERALFFYRRYLALDPKTKKRTEVEKRVKDLEELQKRQSELKQKPPVEVEQAGGGGGGSTSVTPPPVDPTPGPTTGKDSDPAPRDPSSREPASSVATTGPDQVRWEIPVPDAGRMKRLTLGAGAGMSIPVFSGGSSLNSPIDFVAQLQAGYGFAVGSRTMIDAGAKLTISGLAYDTATAKKTASLVGVFATGGVRHRLSSAFSAFAELGLGVVWWGGLVEGNPFTEGNLAPSAAIGMPSLRVTAGVRYETSSGLFVSASPAFGYSIARGGLDVSAVQFIDGLLSLGLAM